MEKLSFTLDETGEIVEFEVVEQTRINGKDYLLVTDSEDDADGDAYILKDLSADGEQEAIYVMVEDDEELEAVSRIFSEMLEDVDIAF